MDLDQSAVDGMLSGKPDNGSLVVYIAVSIPLLTLYEIRLMNADNDQSRYGYKSNGGGRSPEADDPARRRGRPARTGNPSWACRIAHLFAILGFDQPVVLCSCPSLVCHECSDGQLSCSRRSMDPSSASDDLHARCRLPALMLHVFHHSKDRFNVEGTI